MSISVNTPYAKLITNSDDEQAVVEATTCAMGNGGADIVEVFRLKDDGQLVSLAINDSGYTNGPLYEGQTVTPRLEVMDGKLTRWFVMYAKGPTAGNPKAGLKRVITYRWAKNRFIIDTVKDVKDDADQINYNSPTGPKACQLAFAPACGRPYL